MIFEDNSKSVEKELAILLGRVSHHIHPEIVEFIKSKNNDFLIDFKSYCHPKLNYSTFFYKGSDCLFPGVRRPINKEKSPKWKNKINDSDGTIFNDNTYPRHIWAFLTLQKPYSSPSWIKSGLNAFELAHIFGHKSDEQELEKKVFNHFDFQLKPYALFTSASNVVLIPKGLTKPTDKMENIKICFYKRHIDLYGENFLGMRGFNHSFVPEWYSEIKWLEPKLPVNWKQNLDRLIEYRTKHLNVKYQSPKSEKKSRNPDLSDSKTNKDLQPRQEKGMKIGKFVRDSFRKAYEQNLITEDEIKRLQDPEYSKRVFNAGFEVLRFKTTSIKDSGGWTRYYAKELFCEDYHLSSQWKEAQRDSFLKWLKEIGYSHKEKINESE